MFYPSFTKTMPVINLATDRKRTKVHIKKMLLHVMLNQKDNYSVQPYRL